VYEFKKADSEPGQKEVGASRRIYMEERVCKRKKGSRYGHLPLQWGRCPIHIGRHERGSQWNVDGRNP